MDLDGQFKFREIDYDPEGQRETLTLMSRLAEAYLAGKGHEGVKRRILGRRHSELTLELDGETYVFKKKA